MFTNMIQSGRPQMKSKILGRKDGLVLADNRDKKTGTREKG
jgi:hypothetical protein